jgi:hypothetical protein
MMDVFVQTRIGHSCDRPNTRSPKLTPRSPSVTKQQYKLSQPIETDLTPFSKAIAPRTARSTEMS